MTPRECVLECINSNVWGEIENIWALVYLSYPSIKISQVRNAMNSLVSSGKATSKVSEDDSKVLYLIKGNHYA